LTDQEFVRSSITGCEIKEMPSLRFDDILKNLRQINNNLNQIAMKRTHPDSLTQGLTEKTIPDFKSRLV